MPVAAVGCQALQKCPTLATHMDPLSVGEIGVILDALLQPLIFSMVKKIAFASVGLLLLASPLLASAQTATDIQARIGALLAQLAQLQEQLASQVGQQPATPSVSSTPTPSSTSGGCAQIITRFLIVGSSGPDVKELQGFLIARGSLASEASSGYCGPLTQAALQSWQAANGIVSSGDPFSTGYGATGPRTRAVLALACTTPVSPSLPSKPTCPALPIVSCALGYVPTGGGTDSNGCDLPIRCVAPTSGFTASPTSGAAPLSVTFTVTNNFMNGTAPLTVDFGDSGASSNRMLLEYGGVTRPSHVYTSTGTYTAKLIETCGNTATCATSTWVVGNATITVTGGSLLNVSAWLEDMKGGAKESFAYGDQLVVKWTASPISDVETVGWNGNAPDTGIELRPYDNEKSAGIRIVRTRASTVFPYTYTWNVTREGLYGDTVAPGRYYVYVNVASKQQGGYRTGIAGPIWIGATTTVLSSITVVSPNGGGYYSKGEPFQVQWTTQNAPSDNQMLIRLRSTGTNQEYNLTTTLNDGFERVDLSSVPAGAYTLEIKTAVNGQSYVDASDSYFKIVEATPSVSITVNGQTTLTVQEGTYYTLAWSSQNVTSCTMYYARSNGGEPVTSSNSVVANTSDQARMSAIVAYTLTCQSASGPVSQTATVFKTASQNPTFSAWPNSGTAPLTSHLTISGASSASGYSVNFGDGSSDYNWKADTETANTYFMSHTFQTAGTYTAALMYQPPSVPCSAPPGAACMMVMPTPVQVGTATITVAAQNCDAVSGCSYKVDPSTYPTQGVGGTSASSGANANLASALSALESALNELIRMFSTL